MTQSKQVPEVTVSHEQPTYENQLWHARKLLREQGIDALANPHALAGRDCECRQCFVCAAAQVYREYQRGRWWIADLDL